MKIYLNLRKSISHIQEVLSEKNVNDKFCILCLKQKHNTQNKDLPGISLRCIYNTKTIIGEIAHVLLSLNTL